MYTKVTNKENNMTKKKVEEIQVVEDHVVVDLTVDLNDPRKLTVVDGNDLPVVDINVPVK